MCGNELVGSVDGSKQGRWVCVNVLLHMDEGETGKRVGWRGV